MGTRVHIRDLNLPFNSRIPFLPDVKIAIPPLVLFIISMAQTPAWTYAIALLNSHYTFPTIHVFTFVKCWTVIITSNKLFG